MGRGDAPVWLKVGEICGVHGVRGELRLRSHCEPIESIFTLLPWRVGEGAQAPSWSSVRGRRHGKGLLARLEGIEDRDAAEALVGRSVWVPRDRLPPVAEGEYYWADLEGLEVVTREGFCLGRVDHLFATPGNDVMVVRGERERLLPFTPGHCVDAVDLQAGRITVDWDPEF